MESSKSSGVKTIIWIVLALLVIFGIYSVFKKSTPTETGPIKIGFIGPLSGDAAAYGEPVKNGIELAVNEINSAGGVKGRQIQMIYEDGKCSGKDSASAAQKLVNIDKVKYIIGGICSGEAFGFSPITIKAKVFVIMPGASAPTLSGLSPYLVRNNPNDNFAGISLADFVAKSYKNAFTISEQTDFAKGIESVFLAQLQKNGQTNSGTQSYDSKTTDFRSILSKVKETNPDVVFINAQTGANVLRIAQQARQLGIKSQFISAYFGSDPAVQSGGGVVEGMVFADAPGLSSSASGRDFVSKYKAKYGKDPAFAFYAGAAYDGVHLIAQAISSTGDDSTKVEKYVQTLSSYEGTIGMYSFDDNGDIVGVLPVLEKVVNGKLVRI